MSSSSVADRLALLHGPAAETVLRELELLYARCEQQGVGREEATQVLRNERFLQGFQRGVDEAPTALVDGPRDVVDLLRHL